MDDENALLTTLHGQIQQALPVTVTENECVSTAWQLFKKFAQNLFQKEDN